MSSCATGAKPEGSPASRSVNRRRECDLAAGNCHVLRTGDDGRSPSGHGFTGHPGRALVGKCHRAPWRSIWSALRRQRVPGGVGCWRPAVLGGASGRLDSAGKSFTVPPSWYRKVAMSIFVVRRRHFGAVGLSGQMGTGVCDYAPSAKCAAAVGPRLDRLRPFRGSVCDTWLGCSP